MKKLESYLDFFEEIHMPNGMKAEFPLDLIAPSEQSSIISASIDPKNGIFLIAGADYVEIPLGIISDDMAISLVQFIIKDIEPIRFPPIANNDATLEDSLECAVKIYLRRKNKNYYSNWNYLELSTNKYLCVRADCAVKCIRGDLVGYGILDVSSLVIVDLTNE